ncbi:MAG: hypothetical protein L0L20_10545 [Lactococcus lactis]|jgi:hypothetical protein|uniref:Uncharacterized protein n=1 Tax=Lactococcus lactis subsp. lactis TaxID=1360 RepID=A0A1V0P3A8_LACLL|nr:hypothetical protein [Lactococcus lactis]MDN6024123.1 hypothetical protein [Lactobacillus sp.]MDN6256064.1 hypothetical protein [Tetragenococcus koreensis]ARE21261.1 hypothetical protein LLUC06_1718 [Lactococcus lactis subsp. lactis]MDH8063916.1 hypothetical protein [Lactococcus lactis subsp. lactis]MDN5616565.1 hypothetical protein [Lactococcus lactis]
MSEKKYYVGLKSLNDSNTTSHFLWKDHRFYPCFEKSSYAIAKSELAQIMGGAIYKRAGENFVREGSTDVYDDNEWINPLIELVPVEDGE